ncbi:hypothetical protein AALO_G00268090 [Alosa alosa]|uniref:Uncharacterized protein n=1 Tax=Alosa alosa TaxID=278164 RepID=A0AAV6FR88_9TELE|nr:hypothetical protein AALO_G00268090 [Alosa alosa]
MHFADDSRCSEQGFPVQFTQSDSAIGELQRFIFLLQKGGERERGTDLNRRWRVELCAPPAAMAGRTDGAELGVHSSGGGVEVAQAERDLHLPSVLHFLLGLGFKSQPPTEKLLSGSAL